MSQNNSNIYLYGQRLYLNKGLVQSISKIFGIGVPRAKYIVKYLGFGTKIKLAHIGQERYSENIETLAYFIRKRYLVHVELKRANLLTRKRLNSIRHRRAFRYKNRLPVRGQRTKSNAKTARKYRQRLT